MLRNLTARNFANNSHNFDAEDQNALTAALNNNFDYLHTTKFVLFTMKNYLQKHSWTYNILKVASMVNALELGFSRNRCRPACLISAASEAGRVADAAAFRFDSSSGMNPNPGLPFPIMLSHSDNSLN